MWVKHMIINTDRAFFRKGVCLVSVHSKFCYDNLFLGCGGDFSSWICLSGVCVFGVCFSSTFCVFQNSFSEVWVPWTSILDFLYWIKSYAYLHANVVQDCYFILLFVLTKFKDFFLSSLSIPLFIFVARLPTRIFN